mmetsp:Transcript_14368/g.36258  ORF Transcript_14368/g.36258 Transcript_14368/m.36258 type:complete len:203 (+) Transcript_14368:191-799(+)
MEYSMLICRLTAASHSGAYILRAKESLGCVCAIWSSSPCLVVTSLTPSKDSMVMPVMASDLLSADRSCNLVRRLALGCHSFLPLSAWHRTARTARAGRDAAAIDAFEGAPLTLVTFANIAACLVWARREGEVLVGCWCMVGADLRQSFVLSTNRIKRFAEVAEKVRAPSPSPSGQPKPAGLAGGVRFRSLGRLQLFALVTEV